MWNESRQMYQKRFRGLCPPYKSTMPDDRKLVLSWKSCLAADMNSKVINMKKLLLWLRQSYIHCITFYYAYQENCWKPGKTSKLRPIQSTIQIWTDFNENEAKKNFFFEEKKFKMADFSKWPFFKMANSRDFFAKISQIRPWVSRIDWCEAH